MGRQVSNPYFMQSTTKAAGKEHWTSLKQMKAAKQPIKSGITGTGGNMFTISVLSANLVGYPMDLIARLQGPRADRRHHPRRLRLHQPAAGQALDTPRWTRARPTPSSVYMPKRHPKFPNIPTGVEQGFPELGSPTLVGHTLYALPPKTPPEIASVLEAALVKANNDAKTLNEKIEASGSIVAPLSVRSAASWSPTCSLWWGKMPRCSRSTSRTDSRAGSRHDTVPRRGAVSCRFPPPTRA